MYELNNLIEELDKVIPHYEKLSKRGRVNDDYNRGYADGLSKVRMYIHGLISSLEDRT